jgi:hypothetical protein
LKLQANTFRRNLKSAKSIWGDLSKMAIQQLKKLTADSGLTVVSGDLQLLQGRWYITHAGLLRLARRKRCISIKTILVEHFSDPTADRWIFKATVHSSPSRCFVGFGDADPSNVSSTMHAQNYASRKPGLLTERCAKLMELGFALSKSWDLRPLLIRRQNRSRTIINTTMAQTMGSLVCAINFAF